MSSIEKFAKAQSDTIERTVCLINAVLRENDQQQDQIAVQLEHENADQTLLAHRLGLYQQTNSIAKGIKESLEDVRLDTQYESSRKDQGKLYVYDNRNPVDISGLLSLIEKIGSESS